MNETIKQAASKPCPECGGQRVVAEIKAQYVVNIPTGLFSATSVVPVCCTICGYVTLYAKDPSKVRHYYLDPI